MQEAMESLSTSHPQNQQSNSNEDLFEEVEAFERGEEDDDILEEIDHYQSDEGDLPTESNPYWSSTN